MDNICESINADGFVEGTGKDDNGEYKFQRKLFYDDSYEIEEKFKLFYAVGIYYNFDNINQELSRDLLNYLLMIH